MKNMDYQKIIKNEISNYKSIILKYTKKISLLKEFNDYYLVCKNKYDDIFIYDRFDDISNMSDIKLFTKNKKICDLATKCNIELSHAYDCIYIDLEYSFIENDKEYCIYFDFNDSIIEYDHYSEYGDCEMFLNYKSLNNLIKLIKNNNNFNKSTILNLLFNKYVQLCNENNYNLNIRQDKKYKNKEYINYFKKHLSLL